MTKGVSPTEPIHPTEAVGLHFVLSDLSVQNYCGSCQMQIAGRLRGFELQKPHGFYFYCANAEDSISLGAQSAQLEALLMVESNPHSIILYRPRQIFLAWNT
jgi:hypothetical protein